MATDIIECTGLDKTGYSIPNADSGSSGVMGDEGQVGVLWEHSEFLGSPLTAVRLNYAWPYPGLYSFLQTPAEVLLQRTMVTPRVLTSPRIQPVRVQRLKNNSKDNPSIFPYYALQTENT